MELKEAILQTLSELDATPREPEINLEENQNERDALLEVLNSEQSVQNANTQSVYQRKIEKLECKNEEELKELLARFYSDEEKFLNTLQERILVLFEGMQSPNNRDIETKVDMILNFLEFVLAIIDEKKSAK